MEDKRSDSCVGLSSRRVGMGIREVLPRRSFKEERVLEVEGVICKVSLIIEDERRLYEL